MHSFTCSPFFSENGAPKVTSLGLSISSPNLRLAANPVLNSDSVNERHLFAFQKS